MKLELSEKLLTEFVTALDKTFSKPKQVCITGGGGRVIFFTARDSQQVAFSVETETKDFSVAVEAPRFMSAVKQVYGEHVALEFKPKGIVLKYGDVQVDLPFQKPETQWFQQDYAGFDVPDGFLKALTHTMFVPDTDLRFGGTLIDQLEDGSVVARFNGAALAFTKIGTRFAQRFAIFKDFAKLAKTKTVFSHILVSDRGFGLKSEAGVETTSALMEDTYPQDYLPSFGLSVTGPLVNPNAFDLCYVFDAQELKDAVKLVSTVIGEDEQGLAFALEGREKETQALVWLLSAKSYKGLHVEERVRAGGELRAEPRGFKLHKRTLSKALDNYSETMYLIDNQNAIILSDTDGNSVTVLMKLG